MNGGREGGRERGREGGKEKGSYICTFTISNALFAVVAGDHLFTSGVPLSHILSVVQSSIHTY